MSLFSKKRFAIANLMVALDGDGMRHFLDLLAGAARRIADSDGDFDVARAELVTIAESLLEHDELWAQIANWGEVFKKEEDAAAYGDESFADFAGRYLSSGAALGNGKGGGRALPSSTAGEGSPFVVMLSVGYQGEAPDLEKNISTRGDLEKALSAIVALHHKDQLELAHIHYAPAHPEEVLTEDQLLVNYPELVTL